MNAAQLFANLSRLCRACGPPGDAARRAAAEMPLTQAHGPEGVLGIAREGRILWTEEVKARLGRPTTRETPSCAESHLHTDDCTFFYVANFGYPETEAGFLFRQSLETDPAQTAMATPFDSGALWARFDWPGCPPPGDAARADAARDFLAQHSLPVPDFREYLACVLSEYFSAPSEYLRGRAPCKPGFNCLTPADGTTADHRMRHFEQRLRVKEAGGLAVPGRHLQAVFLRGNLAADPDVENFLITCRRAGVSIRTFAGRPGVDTFRALQLECIDYLATQLTVALTP